MRTTFLLAFLLLFITGFAQTQNTLAKQPRILILLDESSSMNSQWSAGKQRYKAAEDIILKLMDSAYKVNNQVEFSLRAFGEQYPAQDSICYDTRNEVMFSKNNITQMQLRLESMYPLGVTPIAYSLEQAAEHDLVDENENVYSIVLITDGGESCGGNICDVVKRLIAHKVYFKPYIVSLVDYAPLKTEYACLGDYLQVTNEKQIPHTVGEIVDAYRPMLTTVIPQPVASTTRRPSGPPVNPHSIVTLDLPAITIPKTDSKTLPKTAKTFKNQDTTAAIKPTAVVRQQDTPARQNYTAPLQTPAVSQQMAPVNTVPVPAIVLPPPAPPVQREQEPIARNNYLVAPKTLTVVTEAPRMYAVKVPKIVLPAPEKEVAPPAPLVRPKDELPRNNYIAQLKILTGRSESPAVHMVRVPKIIMPPPEKEIAVNLAPPTAPTPPPAPKPTPKPTPKKPAFKPTPGNSKDPVAQLTTTNIEAKETSVEVLFTDGKGTFYHTTPQIILSDAATGKEVKRFYRTVDPAGNPDPQKDIPPGNYTITIVGRSGGVRGNKDVPVKLNNDNKITVVVTNGSLHFQYDDGTEPVSEFSAIVVQRGDNGGPMVKQNCNVDLTYAPGNYFVEVNTLPAERHNVDIDFSATAVLTIPRPGFLQITNNTQLGKVSLYCPLGDNYVRFYGMDINGNLAEQKLKLQPGTYQAHYIKDTKRPFPTETVKTFVVKSKETTQLQLD